MSLAGSFLIARPTLRDPSFARTVVLLLAHNEDGAFGLVVNRPTQPPGSPFPVFAGGPCPSPGLFMLHGQADWMADPEEESLPGTKREVAPGIWVGDAGCLDRAGQTSADEIPRYRVFNGYAGWGEGQLEHELAGGAWAVVPATSELLFDIPAEELWDHLSPPRIPQPSLN